MAPARSESGAAHGRGGKKTRHRRRSALFKRRFTRPGAPPGRFAGPDLPNTARLRVLRLEAGGWQERDDIAINELPPIQEQHLTWIDLRGVQDHDAVEAVGQHLGLHRMALADVVNVGQRPKVEEYEGVLFIVLRMAVRDGPGQAGGAAMAAPTQTRETTAGLEAWRWEQISLFVGRGFVASFQEVDGDCLGYVRRRLQMSSMPLSRADEPGELVSMILDAVVDGYFPLLEDLSDHLENLEDEVIERPTRAVLGRIYHLKRELLGFRRAAWPLREVLGHLAREEHPLIPPPVRVFLRDTSDHAVQVVEVLDSYRELAASFVDVYLSSITHQTNEVMRVLTIIATIFIPLTFLAGVYGMNFQVLPELEWRWGYAAFWLTCAVAAGVMLGTFWRLGWIGRSRR